MPKARQNLDVRLTCRNHAQPLALIFDTVFFYLRLASLRYFKLCAARVQRLSALSEGVGFLKVKAHTQANAGIKRIQLCRNIHRLVMRTNGAPVVDCSPRLTGNKNEHTTIADSTSAVPQVRQSTFGRLKT